MLLNTKRRRSGPWRIGAAALAALVLIGVYISRNGSLESVTDTSPAVQEDTRALSKTDRENTQENHSQVVTGVIEKETAIDYQALENNEDLRRLMEARKKSLGLQNSLDMIVQADESFIVGKTKVSMQEILEKSFVRDGKVFEEEIGPAGGARPMKIRKYGIYVVQPGDNIWNIHFRILKEYYASRGIPVSGRADEPGKKGQSSGVGKILKFSETMVTIFNLIEGKVTGDINLLAPLSKVVVYNMDDVFALLEEIDYQHVDQIQFDGKTIWIPAEQS